MNVALLAKIRIEVGFEKVPSVNDFNFEIVCRCCGKNAFKDPSKYSQGIVSFFAFLRKQYCHS